MKLSLGEKATLNITSDYVRIILVLLHRTCLHLFGHQAYGSRGFAPLIPADSDLVFEVELVRIN